METMALDVELSEELRAMRDAVRHYRVGEGASEIQRIVIARDLLRGVNVSDRGAR